MKSKRIILKGLVFGLLFNNINYSYANVKSLGERYETFEGNNITIGNILEEDKANFELEGKTLVNIAPKVTYDNYVINGGTIENEVYTSDYTYGWSGIHQEKNINRYKPNTEYTIYFSIDSNDHENNISIADFAGGHKTVFKEYFSVESGTTGIVKTKLTTRDDLTDIKKGLCIFGGNGAGNFSISNLFVVEGDYLDKNIEFFKGLQSSFEDHLITQEMIDSGQEKAENLEKYKIKVKSIGKNILKNSADIFQTNSGWMKYDNASSTNEYYKNSKAYTTNGHAWSSYGYPLHNLIENNLLDIENEYTFSCYVKSSSDSYSPTLRFYINEEITSASGRIVSDSINTSWQRVSITFKFTEKIFSIPDSSKNKKHYAIRFEPQQASSNGEYLLVSCLQLEKNDTPTEYKVYQESLNTFYLNSPLLEGDTIKYINGAYTHIKRYGQVILNGSEVWQNNGTPQDNFVTYFTKLDNNIKFGAKIFNDKLKWYEHEKFNEMTFFTVKHYNNLYFCYDSTLGISVNEWLEENPITLVYELKNPIYEPIKTDLSVKLFEETTHISNNSNIPANMEIIIDRALNRATESIQLAKTNPTIDNISQARYWINLLKESINKDNLQNQVDNITDIKDLEIELKNATSNMDVYIKSQNGLSMSLSTNSIIFDEFDSTEDMEKLNAVNLTINSSLPYQLNSYMMTELQNKDGSNIIPKELFNIRLNGETDYKAFNDINEKLVLKDDCQKGNNNQFNIDLILKGSLTHKADVYKTTLKFEAEQK